MSLVRKHPAPEGALRREDLVLLLVPLDAPERNLAPEGALRRVGPSGQVASECT